MAFMADFIKGLSQASNQLPQALQQRFQQQQQLQQRDRLLKKEEQDRAFRQFQIALSTGDKVAIEAAWSGVIESGAVSPAEPTIAESKPIPKIPVQNDMAPIESEGIPYRSGLGVAPQRVPQIDDVAPTGDPMLRAILAKAARDRFTADEDREFLLIKREQEAEKAKQDILRGQMWEAVPGTNGVIQRANTETGEVERFQLPPQWRDAGIKSVFANGMAVYEDGRTAQLPGFVEAIEADFARKLKHTQDVEDITGPAKRERAQAAHEDRVMLAGLKTVSSALSSVHDQIVDGKTTPIHARKLINALESQWGDAVDDRVIAGFKDYLSEWDRLPVNPNDRQQKELEAINFIHSSVPELVDLLKDPEVASYLGTVNGRIENFEKSITGGKGRSAKLMRLEDNLLNLKNRILRKESGAAVTEWEMKVYNDLIGTNLNDPTAIRNHLVNMVDRAQLEREAIWMNLFEFKYDGRDRIPDYELSRIPRAPNLGSTPAVVDDPWKIESEEELIAPADTVRVR